MMMCCMMHVEWLAVLRQLRGQMRPWILLLMLSIQHWLTCSIGMLILCAHAVLVHVSGNVDETSVDLTWLTDFDEDGNVTQYLVTEIFCDL